MDLYLNPGSMLLLLLFRSVLLLVKLVISNLLSVTSLLCGSVEKIIVRTYVIPAYCYLSIDDQYAYKPTGSTTCALVDLTHTICMHLEQHNYVRYLMIDFSKAFDTIDHCILISKLK